MPPRTGLRGAPAAARFGAYGFRLPDLEADPRAASVLVPSIDGWPVLRLEHRHEPTAWTSEEIGDERAELVLHGGAGVRLDRAALTAVYSLPHEPTLAAIVHPYLAPAAAMFSHWLGRDVFHAGGYAAAAGGVVGVAGDRGTGKSSTLARLALDGVPIVADDILVLDRGAAFAAPRSLDLREDPARLLGVGEPLGVVGTRERWRLALDPAPSGLPLVGWVFLAWGEQTQLEPLRLPEKLELLAFHRAVRLERAGRGDLLRLAALPGWVLRRRQGWESVTEAAELLRTLDP